MIGFGYANYYATKNYNASQTHLAWTVMIIIVIAIAPLETSLITLATKDTEETVRDAQSCAPSRFENFLRDDGPHRLVYYGKGLDFVATAILKAKSKNAGIRDRTGHLEVRCPKSTRTALPPLNLTGKSVPIFNGSHRKR